MHVCHEYVYGFGKIWASSIKYRQADHGCEEEGHSTKMGNASVESLEAATMGSNSQDSFQNQHIRKRNKKKIKSHVGKNYKKSKDAIDLSVGAREL